MNVDQSGVLSVDALKRRYQVFVSSTYEDLKEERQHVIQALLETKCIPLGMYKGTDYLRTLGGERPREPY